ncbi:hypothetical protein L1887_48032 [Cichorium endivia]|nr:hypothetical protein L1887_48032 [Cichorium endivia]
MLRRPPLASKCSMWSDLVPVEVFRVAIDSKAIAKTSLQQCLSPSHKILDLTRALRLACSTKPLLVDSGPACRASPHLGQPHRSTSGDPSAHSAGYRPPGQPDARGSNGEIHVHRCDFSLGRPKGSSLASSALGQGS